jgi:hypothetical protein
VQRKAAANAKDYVESRPGLSFGGAYGSGAPQQYRFECRSGMSRGRLPSWSHVRNVEEGVAAEESQSRKDEL